MEDQHDQLCKDVLRKVRDVAGEHCETFFFIATVPDCDGELRTVHTWEGTFNAAVGIVERAKERMRQGMSDSDAPAKPEDDSDDWKQKA